jgi:hypothetical protein
LISIIDFNQHLIFVNKVDIDTYKNVDSYLNKDTDNYKVLWVPEMGWHGKEVRPTWLGNYQPSAQAFPEFASSKPTYLHYFTPMTHVYTWLASGHWKSELMSNPQSANLVNILGVKYIIVHTDVPGYQKNTQQILQQLSNNKNFKLVEHEKYLYVFKNLTYESRVWAVSDTNAAFCDAGLACLSSYFTKNSVYNSSVLLTDQLTTSKIIKNINNIYFSLPSQNYNNLVINKLIQEKDSKSSILFAKDFTENISSIGCLSDTHQGEYHTLFSLTESYDYGNSFVFGNCFFVFNNVQAPINLPFTLKQGKYVMLTRYLAHQNGESFTISSPLFNFTFKTKTNEPINYYRYDRHDLNIEQTTELPLTFTSSGGINSISFVAFIPEDIYNKNVEYFSNNLSVINGDTKDPRKVKVFNVKEVNSSEWSMDVESSTPFILNFAEAYNPLWQATVKKDNKSSVVMSSQLDGMINGFYISSTGKSHITLSYAPQEKYNRDFLISLGVFIIMIGGVVLLQRKLFK